MVLDVTKGKVSLREAPKQLELGEAVPDFAMTTQEGKPLKLSDLRGNVVVLTFIYTRCPLPDFCPLMDRKFAELAQRIGAIPDRARHDSPDFALVRPRARHARSAGEACPDPRGDARPLWTFAVASHEELAKIGRAAGALLWTAGRTKSPTTCARRSSIRRENSPVWKWEPPVTSGKMSTC